MSQMPLPKSPKKTPQIPKTSPKNTTVFLFMGGAGEDPEGAKNWTIILLDLVDMSIRSNKGQLFVSVYHPCHKALWALDMGTLHKGSCTWGTLHEVPHAMYQLRSNFNTREINSR